MNIDQEPKYDAIDGKIVNRATGETIPDDEPIMIFRAKDLKSIGAINNYKTSLMNTDHRSIVHKRLLQFIDWQYKNHGKVMEPDSDKSLLDND